MRANPINTAKPPHIGRDKIGNDEFYTRADVVIDCLAELDLSSYDLVVEPSAGDGSFVNNINHKKIIAIDINPKNKKIKKQDYLKYTVPQQYKKVLVIGNPPFGIHHHLSDKFLERSFAFSNVWTVAFILPNTYKKHTRQKIIPSNYRIKAIRDIGKNAFIYKGDSYHVPCSFFVFDKSRGKDLRFNADDFKACNDFDFGDKDNFDFFVFGANPSKITDTPTANNRGYYVISKINIDELKDKFANILWEGNSCASGGVAWITKPELIMQYLRANGLQKYNKK